MMTGSTQQSGVGASRLGSTGGVNTVGSNRSKRAQSAQKGGVLGLSEFNRIKASIAETGKASTLQEDRTKLKEASDNRTKNWSNTILAIRKKKEQDKYEKFEREELERRRIDQEEAEYQSKVKAGVMNKAKKQIFERHDKVKTLHSKMLLSDALQERELQIQIEQQKKKMQEEILKEHHEAILQQCADHDAKEEAKKRELEAKKLHTQEVLRQQHDEFREKHIVRLMEDRLEGEIIKVKAKEAEIEAIKNEELRRQRIKAAQAETMKGNMVLQEIRKKEKEKEALEDEKIKEYERQRDEKARKRKEEQERRFNERQRIRQQMIDKAVQELQKKNDKESERLKKDIEERKVREEFIEKEKREKIERLKQTIDHHRDLYMRDRAAKKARDTEEDKNFQQFWKNKNQTIVGAANSGTKPARGEAEPLQHEPKALRLPAQAGR